MRRAPRRLWGGWHRVRPIAAAGALALTTTACSWFQKNPELGLPESSAAAEARARIEVRSPDSRPWLVLVQREGDPRGALAVASAHDLGSEASTALASLVGERLERAGYDHVEIAAHGLGFQATVLVESPERAADFVRAADRALRTPVQQGEPALAEVKARLDVLKARGSESEAAAAVDACSGELARELTAGVLDPTTAAGAARLEGWRVRATSARSVSLGVLGPSPLLDSAARALDATEAWSDGPGPDDPWPAAAVVGTAKLPEQQQRRLSVALRVTDPGLAIAASRELGAANTSLAQRLQVLDPPWTLERVVGTTRPRGGCLRLDLAGPKTDPGPELSDVSRVVVLTLREARTAVQRIRQGSWALDDAILRPHDPRQAATVAAWRALSGQNEPGEERHFVFYAAPPSELGRGADRELAQAIEQSAAAWNTSTLDVRSKVEAGQGELWALLGTPCGTVGETAADAGLTALVVRALAEKRPAMLNVTIEPWYTPDGVGLLAHAPRLGPSETAEAHAERVGQALAQVLVGTRLSGADVAQSRQAVLDELGGPRPGWRQLLHELSPDHPAWLDARGTWPSVSGLVNHHVDARRRALVLGPLRLGVLANSDEAQTSIVARAIEHWIRPLRDEPRACPERAKLTPRLGEVHVETTADSPVAAYVAVPLPAGQRLTQPHHVEALLHLMNRPGGYLERALRGPELASAAEAIVLGGNQASALVVALSTLPEQTDAAVAQVRGLLQRLAEGALSAREFDQARAHVERTAVADQLDPRRRMLDLWRGNRSAALPDLGSMRRFLRALRFDGHVIVRVDRKD